MLVLGGRVVSHEWGTPVDDAMKVRAVREPHSASDTHSAATGEGVLL